MAGLVALLALHFVDEQLFGARYSRGVTSMLSQIAHSFG
jgi:hypothetical protein